MRSGQGQKDFGQSIPPLRVNLEGPAQPSIQAEDTTGRYCHEDQAQDGEHNISPGPFARGGAYADI